MTSGEQSFEDGLRAWAKGDYTYEAAVELLIRTGWTDWGAFRDDFVGEREWDGLPWIDFEALGDVLRGEKESAVMAASGGELRVLRIAYSLAGNGLSNTIPGLDRDRMALVLAGLAHANGSHEHSDLVEDPNGRMVSERTGTRMSFKKLGTLYPWPEVTP